ncbi:MAG TPA: hypothetical protein ENK06_08320, partial [Gammaproteobacteria bacterium]|nr:hypothetical protein [Gammaproteobacteria bacterium]
PGRRNIVVTRDKDYQSAGAMVVHTLEEALKQAGDVDEIMIIGGASFYQQMLPRADRLYLTYVQGTFEADSWFPDFNLNEWRESSREFHAADDNNPYSCNFVIYDRG